MDEDIQTQQEAFDRITARVCRFFGDALHTAIKVALIYGAIKFVMSLVAAYYRWAGA